MKNIFVLLSSIIFLIGSISSCTAQSISNKKAKACLDSVKVFYGDSCHIGVSSRLIKDLYNYRSNKPVSAYLKQYEDLRDRIISFRRQSSAEIYNNPAIILDMKRIFENRKNMNIINACGFYYGPDSVSSLIVSYSIIRDAVKSFYNNVLQMANFDSTYKKELETDGDDWYKSAKLAQLKDLPFKFRGSLAPVK